MDDSSLDVVRDAGPLLHLDELSCLDLLSDFCNVLVPDQVWREVERHRPGALERSSLRVQRVPVVLSEEVPIQALVRGLALDLGEQAALCLMASHPKAMFLVDDAAARLAAQALGYGVHGTIAIVLRSIRRQQRAPLEVLQTLRDLPVRSSLYIRPTLLEEIIAQVERSMSQPKGE